MDNYSLLSSEVLNDIAKLGITSKFASESNGYRYTFDDFSDGYSLSLVKHDNSYGHETDSWEVEILQNGKVVNNTPIDADVVGKVDNDEVLKTVKDLINYSASHTKSNLDSVINGDSSSFLDGFKDEANKSDLTLTDNGALVYNSSGNNFVDFEFAVSSLRGATQEETYDKFRELFLENRELSMRFLFYLRDIRGGKGERRIFHNIIEGLMHDEPQLVCKILPLIPEYGYWGDLKKMMNVSGEKFGRAYLSNTVNDKVRDFYLEQLLEDYKAMQDGEPCSLAAKFAPSLGNKKALRLVDKLEQMDAEKKGRPLTQKERNRWKSTYRHMLSDLRGNLNVIEKALSEKDTQKLLELFPKLSSKQNLKYQKALMRLMPEERKDYLEKAIKGEVNFNVDVLEPHEIYFKYCASSNDGWNMYPMEENLSFETMWKLLPNKVVDGNNVLVVRDGSGSMLTGIPGTNNGTVLDVASALAIYFSEHSEGEFKDKFITFSSRPKLVDLSKCVSLKEKMELLSNYTEVANTNIERTFDLILQTAINKKLPQEQLPSNLLIVSDMQFDAATGRRKKYDETLFETIKNKFEEHGYQIPRLIFWNVNVNRSVVPMVENDKGLVLLGGFSKNTISMIAENDFEKEVVNEKGKVEKVQLTPAEILLNKLNDERYDAVSEVVRPYFDMQKTKYGYTEDILQDTDRV